jgi:hypothetical protein
MSQQGPIIVVSSGESALPAAALGETHIFPVVDATWRDAAEAVARVQPAAVLATHDNPDGLTALAQQIEAHQPYVPLIVFDPAGPLPHNALPFTGLSSHGARLAVRLKAALRVRTLHATVLRRLGHAHASSTHLPPSDPLQDATVLLIGRGASYPALSVALGERTGVVGALSIEAAAKHLNARDLDGVVIGDGFSSRVVDAFLQVLSEDSRFRHLPVILTGGTAAVQNDDLPNLEFASGTAIDIVTRAVPLIRQSAFELRLHRALQSIDAGGLLDPRTGLLTQDAFARDFANAVIDAKARGAALSAVRLELSSSAPRARLDAARILSRLMRRMDFATLHDDASIVIAFPETDQRTTRMIARRLASVLKQTIISSRKDGRFDPEVTFATLQPDDNVETIIERLRSSDHRAAS